MYRAWERPKNEKYVISLWDGDCTTYTICENEKEYKEGKARIEKINREYKEKMKEYLNTLIE